MKWTRNGMETGSCWVYSNIDKLDDSISFSYQCKINHVNVKVKLSCSILRALLAVIISLDVLSAANAQELFILDMAKLLAGCRALI